ncbi:FAD-binding oxidoreductase [Aestuariibius insulae]|uniref:FAD-binding oxidoreductase n=1 Tax=Aestuariibius insulae TaxID=2058287 RepID=UPI00345E8A07
MTERLAQIVGPKHVLTGSDAEPFSRDWSGRYRWSPKAVVRPGDTAEVSKVLKLANDAGCPVVAVSGNTSVSGGTTADGAIVLSLSRLNKIRKIDPHTQIAVVEAGVILSNLHDAADAEDMIFPLTFGARGSALIGGCLSTNAGGSNVLRYGNTRDLCLGIEVVLPDGRIMDLMSELHKNNTGLDLRHLMIGAEGTLGIITAAVLKLHPKPKAVATAMIAPRDLRVALEVLNKLNDATGRGVDAFEYMPRSHIEGHLALSKGAREPFEDRHEVNVLLEVSSTRPVDAQVDADGTTALTGLLEAELARRLETGDIADAVIARSEAQRREMWERREAAAEVAYTREPRVDSDIALPLDKVAGFFDEAMMRLRSLDPEVSNISVTHLGDGNIHYCVYPSRDDETLKDGIRETIEQIVAESGGSFSAEHGIGVHKLSTMRRRKDEVALDVMRAIKTAIDPKGILNPGKVFPARN